MNDNQIAKALHVCGHDGDCHECPAFSVEAFEIEDFTKCHEVMQGATNLIESLQSQLAASQRRERAAVENYNVLVGLIAKRLSAGSFEKLCELADELEVFVTDWRGPQEAGKGEAE